MESLVSLDEFERAAEDVIPQMALDYYKGAAEGGDSMRENKAAFSRYNFVPRMLREVGTVDTTTEVLGNRLSMPVMIAPMAMMRMAHADGEIAVANASGKHGVSMCLSTMATTSLEDVRRAFQLSMEEHRRKQSSSLQSDMWFQLYVLKDRKFTADLLRRAQRHGYKAVVITVDAPVLGKREADEKNRFQLPHHLRLYNIEGLESSIREQGLGERQPGSALTKLFADQLDNTLDWSIIKFVKQVVDLPVLVKGVLSPDDAELAVRAGADGIVVSNHGGRQLNHSLASLDALPAVAQRVARRVPVLLDGGIRRGTDVLMALMLGADAVLLGRPVLWGLAVAGEKGVSRVLDIVRDELRRAMALCGVRSVQEAKSQCLLIRKGEVLGDPQQAQPPLPLQAVSRL